MIGQTISHYKVLEKLGEGGMGVVYRAEDTRLKRTVALKFLPPDLTSDTEAKRRFIHEAQAASTLQHHNICTIHEIDETDDGQLFICMDCYEGTTLKDITAEGPLPVERAIDLTIQVSEGLARAHEEGMVHRDIKTANIMVTKEGVVKVLDFGLAKLAGQTKITKTGRTVGTVAFMSPEQTRGDKIDSRSDIFSLGVVLYNLLTGRLPFEADHEAAVIYKITSQKPESLATHMNAVPKGFQRIIDKALEKDQDKRYQSIDDLINDLLIIHHTITSGERPRGLIAGKRRRTLMIAASVLAIFAAAVFMANRHLLQTNILDPLAGTMIAVLPFENLGPPEDDYFANGITEAVTVRLAGITGISVISRQSTMQFKDSKKSIQEIGDELGVNYILEGSVQRELPSNPACRVRVIPQLVRVSDDIRVWVDSYDEEMKDIFRVQSEIAEHVATALDVTLLGADRQELGKMYTHSIEAYDHYLRGEEHAGVMYDENVHKALQSFEAAIALDPEFALAWAGLSMTRSWLYFSLAQKHELTRAKDAADRALELDPDLPEAHMALGFHYYRCRQDYRNALRHLSAAQRRRPSDERIIRTIAHVHRRGGNWDQAIELYEKALVLNPKIFMTHFSLGQTFRYLGRYEEAEQLLTHAITLSPSTSIGYLEKEALYVHWDGETRRAEQVMLDAFRMVGPKNLPGRYYSSMMRILYAGSEDVVSRIDQIILSVHEDDTTDYYFNKAAILERNGEKDRSLAYYDSLRAYLTDVAAREEKIDPFLESFLGFACAKLGQWSEAIRHGETSIRYLPVSKDAVLGPFLLTMLAAIYAEVGERDKAVEKLEYLLSIPGDMTPVILRLDPVWDPLREHTRFQSLITEYN